MKLITTTLLLFTASILFSQNHQDKSYLLSRNAPYKKVIHFMPLSLSIGGLEVGFEKPTSTKESIKIDAGIYISENAGALKIKDDNYNNLSGFRTELQYRFYKHANNYKNNYFLAPFLNVKTLTADYSSNLNGIRNNEVRSASAASFGYMVGFHNALMDNVYLDFSVGGGLIIPISGDFHEELSIPFFNPYQRGTILKANFGFSIAL